ncbi:MAG TPA: 30S ribosomal protein S3ae [Candidatus Lokiarchaeia archaeon]|nr:30S ribosomal protein S3ae [Candidatus Lokiarchaeia archaeon]
MPKLKTGEGSVSQSKRRARKQIDKWKAKQWYTINASPEFDSIYIGQTPASEEELLFTRILENSLYDFTQDFNDASVKLRFKIVKVNGNLCETMFVGHEMTRDFIRSLVRRGSNRVQIIVDLKTKDGYTFRITGTAFTENMSRSSQQKTIRKIVADVLTERAKNLEFKPFVQDMVFGNIERDIKRLGSEIMPLREVKLLKSVLLASPKVKE